MNIDFSKARLIAVGLSLALVFSCASVPRRNPLPPELADAAEIPGIPNGRIWGDEVPHYAETWFEQTEEQLRERYSAWYGKQQYYLAISGGGAGGAFGAGLLVGWTEAGDRPEFQLVTGISTGALTAPFAFLGPDYDFTVKYDDQTVRYYLFQACF